MFRRRFVNSGGIDINNYLTIEALMDDTFIFAVGTVEGSYYSVDGGTFVALYGSGANITLKKGQTASFKGEYDGDSTVRLQIQRGAARAFGNILSLIYGDEANSHDSIEGCSSCFYGLFSGSPSLIEVASDLLPFKTLASYCYSYMFSECTNLVQAPELPATDLVQRCYLYMFYGCSSLNFIKALFTLKDDPNTTQNWLQGVASTGTFVKNKNATWDEVGDDGVPEGWTIQYE